MAIGGCAAAVTEDFSSARQTGPGAATNLVRLESADEHCDEQVTGVGG